MVSPAIILVRPQLGENIGMVARAMANFGLDDLRIVAPRDGWPNEDAVSAAAGADKLLGNARVTSSVEEAIADLRHLFASTVRERDMVKPVVDAEAAAVSIGGWTELNEPSGILFGAERSGLDNDDVSRADTILTIPVNTEFPSLNLAQSVGIIGYACFDKDQERHAKPGRKSSIDERVPATKGELAHLFEHLSDELDHADYFLPVDRRPSIERNLRNLLQNAGLSENDVRRLRGIIVALTGRKQNPR